MAHAPSAAIAMASHTPSVAIPSVRDTADHSGTAHFEKRGAALLITPPHSVSPELAAHAARSGAMSPPPINIEQDTDMQDDTSDVCKIPSAGVPLSKGALSNLDGAAAITPSMLAKHHLPGIMLGNGPRPIRHVIGELTQTVPGFSRIPPAKARRIVVAALESREGGGVDGSIAFSKTGWGRWDAHIKGSSRDSGIGSFNEGHLSPPRSEHGSYAVSHSDSAINIPAQHMHSRYREHYSGGSWTASSLREEDELDMDMDPIEEAADNMSLDGSTSESSDSTNDETDEEDWAAIGVDALRKASLPTSNVNRPAYRKVSVPYTGRFVSKSWTRPPSVPVDRTSQQVSQSFGGNHGIHPAMQSPEERAAVAALMSMGSM
ncbi:uncharacterized protein MYCFIDRAFT_148064 [Pseudocercospora fijiensis CIRAD86]|uniref:Sin3 binding protein n=1 Tax=Pseudocercospora fijiensis (strain CIRAD86) TaxID=383855 RepID=N1Q900_PSEFD|nr:uncharacterized protein MYCFIDRAFT_148064 [Pseudocercospora fijiensis CIRAD86]EME87387.1 hypothetical protein MYCFIDRAFT_148064 [Pseudocercospora fijiensis CIRAD86]